MSLLSANSPLKLIRDLRHGNQSATFLRLGRSRHVADLRLIFWVTLFLAGVAGVLAFAFNLLHEHLICSAIGGEPLPQRCLTWLEFVIKAIVDAGIFIGAVGSVAGAVLTWTYQTGSTRLGVLDLFACEIATICRVGTIVDLVKRYAEAFDMEVTEGPKGGAAPGSVGGRFVSQESYFPVFDTTVRDLQSLDASVVKNVTAFYTYMKIMRDFIRKLGELRPAPTGTAAGLAWRRAICNVIYMQFLALESGRRAVADLVEFEPTQAEELIAILLSELPAYNFLRAHLGGDFRWRRLELRKWDYQRDIPCLYRTVIAGTGPEWSKAKDTAMELDERYEQVFGSPIQKDCVCGGRCDKRVQRQRDDEPVDAGMSLLGSPHASPVAALG